ncbi:aminoacyl-tRNA hydrolase [Leptolyngbya sp. FACHB-261]|nr:aminoacyl-tRNA hydrolase [Leptolyngbya sp. FACHB-261]
MLVGLGNPGAKYERTRHNIGFEAIDYLARNWRIPLSENKRFQGIFGEGQVGSHRVRLLKPFTYMNLSGQSVRAVVDWYKLEPASVLVFYDDLDLPVGRIRLRSSGSAGGHNGVKSLIGHLGTQEFPRLRYGIGRPAPGEQRDTVNYVLGTFRPEERELLSEVMVMSRDAVELIFRSGFEKAMSLYNGRSALKL